MPATWSELFALFGALGLTLATVAAAAAWVFQTVFSERLRAKFKGRYDAELEMLKAKQKSENDVLVERLKSELSIAAAQDSVRFSKLQEKRADVIAETYASLVHMIACLEEYVKIYEQAGGVPREVRRMAAGEAITEFRKLYSAKKIFIPRITADKLDVLVKKITQNQVEFAFLVDLPPQPSTEKWLAIFNSVRQLAEAPVRDLEADFRKLLGDNEG